MSGHHPWLKHSPEKARESLAAVSWDAAALWHVLLFYMADTGTDGTLAKKKLVVATDRRLTQRRIDQVLPELFEEELLVDLGDKVGAGEHWHQPPVETWTDPVLHARWRRKAQLRRMPELTNRIKDRDRHLCRYCGHRVNWTDRRGLLGGTYDHVDPDGENTFDNVVVACRRCNGRKKDRTPDQAGMPLYRPGTTAAIIAAGSARTVAASAGHDRSPEPRARSSDQVRTQSGSDPGAGSARAPARDETDPVRTESDPAHHESPDRGSPPAFPTADPDYLAALLED